METVFWDTFLAESLQKPWRIQQVRSIETQLPIPKAPHVFVFTETLGPEKVEMLNNMVIALKWSANNVQILNIKLEQLDDLTVWPEPKAILFFGDEFPGDIGVIKNWYGHRMGQTHSLQKLLEQTDLKRQTWQHLKDFAGIDR